MSLILDWLAGGDLRSDGLSDEVAELVLKNLHLLDELVEGLSVPDDVVRGRTADALEKISRSKPEMMVDHLPLLLRMGKEDKVPMVRWHIAMMLGHLAVFEERIGEITSVLLQLLSDESAFVRSWAIVSLCIIGRKYPSRCERIVNTIAPLQQDRSIAIRSRARKAINLLTNESAAFPDGWLKAKHLEGL